MNDLIPAADDTRADDADVIVSVCTTCKTQDDRPAVVGPSLLAAVREIAGADNAGVAIRAVQCLGVCKRPTTAAVTGPDRYTFIFADLAGATGARALIDFADRYRRVAYGLVPWRERALELRRGLIARIPPAIWSPESGEPPR